jgi:hypothetical protein
MVRPVVYGTPDGTNELGGYRSVSLVEVAQSGGDGDVAGGG